MITKYKISSNSYQVQCFGITHIHSKFTYTYTHKYTYTCTYTICNNAMNAYTT